MAAGDRNTAEPRTARGDALQALDEADDLYTAAIHKYWTDSPAPPEIVLDIFHVLAAHRRALRALADVRPV